MYPLTRRHTAPQAAVPAHETPGALPFSHEASEVVVPAHDSSEAAMPAHFLPDSEPAQFHEPTESSPEPTPVWEPTESLQGWFKVQGSTGGLTLMLIVLLVYHHRLCWEGQARRALWKLLRSNASGM